MSASMLAKMAGNLCVFRSWKEILRFYCQACLQTNRHHINKFWNSRVIKLFLQTPPAHPVSLHNAIRDTKPTGNRRTCPVPQAPRHDIPPTNKCGNYKNPSAVFHIKGANSALLLGNFAFKSSQTRGAQIYNQPQKKCRRQHSYIKQGRRR